MLDLHGYTVNDAFKKFNETVDHFYHAHYKKLTAITGHGEISKEIWKEYIHTLPEKDQGRVKLILSKLTSPTQTAYGFVKRVAKKGDEVYLVKSAKNANNHRFASFKTIKKNLI